MSTPIQAASADPTPEIHPLRWNLCRLRRGRGQGLTVTYEAVPIEKITQTKKAVVRGDDGQLRLDKKADQVVETTSPNPLGFSASSRHFQWQPLHLSLLRPTQPPLFGIPVT